MRRRRWPRWLGCVATASLCACAPDEPVAPVAPVAQEQAAEPQPAAAPEPATIEPRPATTEPQPATTEPRPATTEPRPATTEPRPATIEPRPATIEPRLATTEPQPATTEPRPATIEPRPATTEPQPQRIVSLDFCADQYVLEFVERDRILALSPDAQRQFSYLRDRAAGLPTVRPIAENVIILEPDLVVRSYGGGPRASALFERAGIAVHTVSRAEDFESILRAIPATAQALGSMEKGLVVAAEMQTRMAALRPHASGAAAPIDPAATPAVNSIAARAGGRGATALYVTPGGVTSGPGTLIHAVLAAAGLENFQARSGWGPIPLERLAYDRPDLIAAAFHEDMEDHPHVWSATRHPLARARLDGDAVIPIEGAWTACAAWFVLDAVEALARGRATVRP